MAGNCRRRVKKIMTDGSAMKSAINAVLTRKFPISTAARTYGVNPKMLQRRLDVLKTSNARLNLLRKLRNANHIKEVFTAREEMNLKEHLLEISRVNPLTLTCIRREAYEYALSLPHCQYPKKWDHMKMTGINWAYSYRSRHPTLRIICGSGVTGSKENGSGEMESMQPETEETPISISDVYEGKAIIVRVYNYLETEYEYLKFFCKDGCDLSPLTNILKRTAAATGVSEQNVTTLLQEQQTATDPLKEDKQDRPEHWNTEMIAVKEDPIRYEYEPLEESDVEVESTTEELIEDEPNESLEQYEDMLEQLAEEQITEEQAELSSDPKPHKKRKLYSPTLLNAALKAIRDGATVMEASKLYGIPRTTLRDKIDNKYTGDRCGPPSTLTKDEQKKLVDWILTVGNAGFRVTKKHLLDTIAKYVKDLNRANNFKNGVPGRVWYRNFIYQHPIIADYVIRRYRKCRINESDTKLWFSQIEQYMKQNNLLNVLKDPDRIFNCDEIGLFLNPTVKHVVIRNSHDKDYIVEDEGREWLTVVANVSARGIVAPSMILYRQDTKSSEPLVPVSWGVCNSESRWLENESFSKYIIECFYPWLLDNHVKLPIIVFLDGCANYISQNLLAFSQEKGIYFMGLLPNVNQLLQPIDTAVFRPLEQTWRNVVQSFASKNNCSLSVSDFANQVRICFDQCVTARTIEAAFKSSGIYPFGFHNVNYFRSVVKNRNKSNNSYCDNV